MRLAVELYDTVLGTLAGDARTFDFTPTGAAVERFGAEDPSSASNLPKAVTMETSLASQFFALRMSSLRGFDSHRPLQS